MNLSVWHSKKSLLMQEIRRDLKKKSEKGQQTLSRKEANKTWREDILGILSTSQKEEVKKMKQQKNLKNKSFNTDKDEDL